MPWFAWLLVAIVAMAASFALGWYLSSLGDVDDGESSDPGTFIERQWSAEAERRLVALMPDAMVVLSGQGLVRYRSPDADDLGILEHDRLISPELEDILEQVVSDGVQREREIHVAPRLTRPDMGERDSPARSGGKRHAVEYVRVRIGVVDDDVYVMFLSDISEQRHFASVRRDFVTNVSHELKTPAGAIALLAETVMDAADDPDAVRYFANRMGVESKRLTQLVYRLIDLQRAQSLDAVKDRVPVRVFAVAKDAIVMNQTQAQARAVELRLVDAGNRIALDAVTDSGPRALVDRESLTTAVKNLIENAIRYSPEHSVVTIEVREEGGRVLLRVIDRGIGIPKDALDRIFERFYRVDSARSRETGGSGLGLSIAKHCIEENGGTLDVWSHENLGSTFTITLQGVDETAQGAPAEAHAAAPEQKEEVVHDANSDR